MHRLFFGGSLHCLIFVFQICLMIHSLPFKKYSVVAFYLLIIAGSSIPGQSIPGVFQLTPDKLLHCGEYFVFGFLITRWVDTELKSPISKIVLSVLILGGLCAMVDELYQHLTPNRTPDVYDWIIDFAGIAISIPSFYFLQRFRKN
jgi:VanZ family protein